MIPLNTKATISAGPASCMAGPTRLKIEPPIIAAIPTIVMSSNDRLRTRPGDDFSEDMLPIRVEKMVE